MLKVDSGFRGLLLMSLYAGHLLQLLLIEDMFLLLNIFLYYAHGVAMGKKSNRLKFAWEQEKQ